MATTEYLISAGANVYAEDNNRTTPFDFTNRICHAIFEDHAVILDSITRDPSAPGVTSLLIASMKGYAAIVEYLL